MPGNLINQSNKPYLKIVGGNLVQTVDKNTEGAKLREYELPNGEKGSKWELTYMNWTGKIQNIQFKDTEFGTLCMIDLGDAILSLNTESRYFQDVACKLCGADLNKELTFHPFDIELEGGKSKRGISLQQAGEKLQNYFYDYENKKSLHGFPLVDEKKKEKKTYWKVYFAQVAEFLIEKVQNLNIPQSQVVAVKDESVPAEDITIDDLPF